MNPSVDLDHCDVDPDEPTSGSVNVFEDNVHAGVHGHVHVAVHDNVNDNVNVNVNVNVKACLRMPGPLSSRRATRESATYRERRR